MRGAAPNTIFKKANPKKGFAFFMVRPAGRTNLAVQVLYRPVMGNCQPDGGGDRLLPDMGHICSIDFGNEVVTLGQNIFLQSKS